MYILKAEINTATESIIIAGIETTKYSIYYFIKKKAFTEN